MNEQKCKMSGSKVPQKDGQVRFHCADCQHVSMHPNMKSAREKGRRHWGQ